MYIVPRTTKRNGQETPKLRKNNDKGHFEIYITLQEMHCFRCGVLQKVNNLYEIMILNFLMIKWVPGPITLNDPKIDTNDTDCPNTDLANYLGQKH